MDTRGLRAPPDSSGGAASRSRARQARSPLTLLARLGSAEASGRAAGEESPDARPLGSHLVPTHLGPQMSRDQFSEEWWGETKT